MCAARLTRIIDAESNKEHGMNGTMTRVIAQEHAADLGRVADLYRAAERRRETPSAFAPDIAARVELRFAGVEDGDAVMRLAALDDRPEPHGRVLLALLDGHAVAALSLEDGRVVANPFVAAADAVAMLRLRADQLAGRSRRQRRRWVRLRLA
jgi:hypothetical protein